MIWNKLWSRPVAPLLTQKELILAGVSLLAGGACGAILKILYDTYQSRIQPVGYNIDIVKVFNETLGSPNLTAELQIRDGVETRHFENLFIAEILIRNRGNADINEFRFGVTLGGEDKAIYTESEQSDRHHSLERVSNLALGDTAKEIDFVAQPFNRKDIYRFKIFISIPTDNRFPEAIILSTAHPVKFVNSLSADSMLIVLFKALGGSTTEVVKHLSHP